LGFRDEGRAGRRSFFLFKSFSLLRVRLPMQGNQEIFPGPTDEGDCNRARSAAHNGFFVKRIHQDVVACEPRHLYCVDLSHFKDLDRTGASPM
jgi:hypothetical protein